MSQPRLVSSRDNPQYKALKRAVTNNSAYKKTGWVWLEGDHLCRAAAARGFQALEWVISDDYWPVVQVSNHFVAIKKELITTPCTLLPKALMAALCATETTPTIACRMALPASSAVNPSAATVVLDRVQDAGNVGSILRSASAFGYTQVLAFAGTAALWSPKVLRAAMGAHFGLHLHEGLEPKALQTLVMPKLATSSHGGNYLHGMRTPWPHAWLFGNEGEGLSPAAQAQATQLCQISQPGGEESLNVAAAAAVCLHAGGVVWRGVG